MSQHLLVYHTVPVTVTPRLLDSHVPGTDAGVRVGFYLSGRLVAEWTTARAIWHHFMSGPYLAIPRRLGLIATCRADGGLEASIILLIPEDDEAFRDRLCDDGVERRGIVAELLDMEEGEEEPGVAPDAGCDEESQPEPADGVDPVTDQEAGAVMDDCAFGAPDWSPDTEADWPASRHEFQGEVEGVDIVPTDLFVIGTVRRVPGDRRYPESLAQEAMDVLRQLVGEGGGMEVGGEPRAALPESPEAAIERLLGSLPTWPPGGAG